MTLTRAAAVGLAVLAACAAAVIVPGHANAATAYRYWAYYVAHGTSWQYSQRGPASEYPVDGEVQGWRFAVQIDAGNGLMPRAAPSFAKLCASTPAKAGELRVGVVIDFGLPTDAPAHEKPPAGVVPGCVYVRDGGTGTDVLAAAAAIRIGTGADAGLVCGIDGYPKTECAVAVAAKPASPAPAPSHASASPQAPATTHPPAPTPLPAAAPATAVNAPLVSSPAPSAAQSSGAPSPLLAQPSPLLAQSPVAAPSPVPATASALSLAALRSNTRHGRGVAATTIAGIALIAILSGAAVWRTRARGR